MSHKFKIEVTLVDKDYCNGCIAKRRFGYCEAGHILPKYVWNNSILTQPRAETCKESEGKNEQT